MEPIPILAVAVGAVALAVLIHSLAVLARPIFNLKVTPMATASSVLTTAESALASPLVQQIVSDFLATLATSLEARAADPTVKSLEELGFALVIDRVKAIGATPTPAAS